MLFQIKTINGQKTIVPLTADAGAGNPVGTIIPMYKKSSPSGYLYCDGSTFDETVYPLLYAYLGTNVLPDYREFALVGAEQNTTSSNIADHDVYTEGQEKDDQVQNHSHNTDFSKSNNSSTQGGSNVLIFNNANTEPTTGVLVARVGTTTRGKRKAVYFYIKATSGLSENAQDNVINTLNEERSYSTEEVNTGKKWIDGKDIYSKTVENCIIGASASAKTPHNISNMNEVTKIEAKSLASNGQTRPIPFAYFGTSNWYCGINVDYTDIVIEAGSDFASLHTTATVTIEYTKTN